MPAPDSADATPDVSAASSNGTPSDVAAFIARWRQSGASERANAQQFIIELCDLLDVPRPDPATDTPTANAYAFERVVYLDDGEGRRTANFIDCYKRDAFVLEAKQGSDAPATTEAEDLGADAPRRKRGTARRDTRMWARSMKRAREQALRYARALPADEGWPPFLVVVDVGYCIDLYADFARQGKTYVPFPDPQRYRITLDDLADEAIRERLRLLWTDPLALDPARTSAKVTRQLAEQLGTLAASLEAEGHPSGRVAQFLMQSLFTMFAEDVGLLPERSFTGLLEDYRGHLDAFPKMLTHLWQTMDTGGFAPEFKTDVRQFNGTLFKDAEALPVSAAQLDLLIRAAEADWADVEPAIFGTLLERALDPKERHKLGAHFTPRAYVERLVNPTIIEPLRLEWDAAQAAAKVHDDAGDEEAARTEIVQFHRRLCSVRVLDPACGSGNFLYVTLEHLKRLEAEVLEALTGYAGQQALDMTGGFRVSPEQLLGIEINPRAAAIAEVVLWIGYLQWHFRTYGSADRLDAPLLKDYGNIECRDAVLTYAEKVPRTDEDGTPVTRWDGETYTTHPATGEPVPDEAAQVPVYDYTDPDMAAWPEADFIVGNPPFVGASTMREALGDGYTEAVRSAYLYRVPKSADFVMFWWYKAAEATRKGLDGWTGTAERFGLISTNSIRQTFNRRVIEKQATSSPPVSLAFAIPDHPWVVGADGADVRIAMTVGTASEGPGTLQTVTHEDESGALHRTVELAEKEGNILPDLTTGADVAGAEALEANADVSSAGVKLHGAGFIVKPEKAATLGLGKVEGLGQHIRPYRNGRDLTQTAREVMVIDLYGLEAEEVRDRFPATYQHVKEHVKPDRDQNRRKSYRENWWIHGEPRSTLRDAMEGLTRYIATPETAKHRFFQFLDISVVPDNMVVAIALEDAFHLGVLSSRIHVTWALAAGGRLGVGNDPRYTKTQCFDPFPFPDATAEQQQRIRDLGEQLDAHRKRQLAAHEGLTMTACYNVLDTLRAGDALDESERQIHEQGLIGVLKELHDDLDAAVADAYGWPVGLSDEAILERLVALNAERRAEEEQGRVRYLRPAYQNPGGTQQGDLALDVDVPTSGDGAPIEKQPWPDTLAARMQAVQQVVRAAPAPLTPDDVAAHFKYARKAQVRHLLDTLDTLGLLRTTDGRYAG